MRSGCALFRRRCGRCQLSPAPATSLPFGTRHVSCKEERGATYGEAAPSANLTRAFLARSESVRASNLCENAKPAFVYFKSAHSRSSRGNTIRPAILQTSNSKVAENWNGHVKTLPQVGTSVAQPRGDHRRQLLALALRLSRQPARCNTYPASSVLQLQHRKQLHLRRPQYRSRSVSAVGETVAAGSLRRGKSN